MRHQGEHFDAGLGRENFGVLRGSTFHQKSGECHDFLRKINKINIHFLQIKCTNRHNYAAMIPSEPG